MNHRIRGDMTMSTRITVFCLLIGLMCITQNEYWLTLAQPIAHRSNSGKTDQVRIGSIDELVLAMDPDEGDAGEMIVVEPSDFAVSVATFDPDYGDGDEDNEALLVGKNRPR